MGLQLCHEAGWTLLPFVADTFGALRYDTRRFIASVITRRAHRFAPLTAQEAARTIWSSLSAAALLRAAGQLARHTAIDQPLSLPLGALGEQPGPEARRQPNPSPAPASPQHPETPPPPDSIQLLVQMLSGKTLTIRLPDHGRPPGSDADRHLQGGDPSRPPAPQRRREAISPRRLAQG